ncbi:polyamine oxidase 1-like [Anneissia japonica]|uniref:polyamine oxidase 1-like n=1 Tax=Anneissia japonica TaxID=1529436 RepID=UPI0014255FC6|nr:polyamine oxidase 1-like [Anneissia japonica]
MTLPKAAILLLTFCFVKSENDAKVLILGAGAAGLKAAEVFHDQGMNDFIIIEGTNHTGGRVADVLFAGMRVDIGASWAHPGNTKIITTVLDLGIEHHVTNFSSRLVFNQAGNDVTDSTKPIFEKLDKAIKYMADKAKMSIAEDEPDISQRAALRLGGWYPKTPVEKAIEWFDFDFEWADIPEVTSTKSTALLETDDDILFVKDPRGFKYIFKESTAFLYEDPAFEDRLQLNKIVTAVNYEGDKVVVTCKDGTNFTGDYVLMTFSLGVLQNEVVDFQPELPKWKIQELYKFIMADYTKIFMKFDSKFWSDEEWFVHAHARRGYFPVFYNLEAEGLFPKGTNMLVAFVVGNEAKRIEQQSNDETSAEITTVLRTLFDGATAPTKIHQTDWSMNPFTYGAYSNWPVEVSEECFQKIQSRVGRIFFGGEHTDEKYNGYIIGGQRSGEREAMKILGCMATGDDVECPIWTKQKKIDCDCDSSKWRNVTIVLSTIIVVLTALPLIILLWRLCHNTN